MEDVILIKVYYARAMDNIDETVIVNQYIELKDIFFKAEIDLIDTYTSLEASIRHSNYESKSKKIVNSDLELLKKVDAVFMDLSIKGRSYIGCSCELVYAHLWNIPIFVYTGDTDNIHRYWLKYHSTYISNNLDDTITKLINKFN